MGSGLWFEVEDIYTHISRQQATSGRLARTRLIIRIILICIFMLSLCAQLVLCPVFLLALLNCKRRPSCAAKHTSRAQQKSSHSPASPGPQRPPSRKHRRLVLATADVQGTRLKAVCPGRGSKVQASAVLATTTSRSHSHFPIQIGILE